MRKLAMVFVLALPLLGMFLFPAAAEDENAIQEPAAFRSQLEASGAGALVDALPDDARDTLHALGVDGVDLYSLLGASPRDIIALLFDMLQGGLGKVLRAGAMALGVVLLLSFAFAAMPEDEKIRHSLEVTGSMLALILLLPGLAELMRAAAAVVKAGSNFALLLIPILAGVITAAAKPALALSYHSIAFGAAQGLSQLADGVIVPCTGVVLGLSLVDGAAKDARLSAVANTIKKAVIGAFALLAGLFSALLSIRGLIANTADALVVRGVKVVAGSIPLVGGALSEACGAILSSVSLVKGAVGGFALLAALALYAPALVELLLWSVMLKLLAAASELFQQSKAAEVFKSAAYAVAILGACVVFNAALLLISTGLVITVGKG
ncbi:MAG: stage III sporulation protein AE [Oscillospiraceae bacterium]|jgi:stage III sporulation protein AE|nr:stage III sporulation protein AE [Oscillospiraceae bacterium]